MAIPQLKPRVTIEDYLRLERDATEKHDYYRGEIFNMSGGFVNHSQIIMNVGREIGNRIKGGRCRAFDSNLRVRIPATDLYTYPDVTVICGDVTLDPLDRRGETVTNPTLLVEVLSPSTEGYDRGLKAHNYRQIETLQEHVFVSQNAPTVDVYSRQADGGWRVVTHQGLDATAKLASLGIELPLSEIYADVTFPAADSERRRPDEA